MRLVANHPVDRDAYEYVLTFDGGELNRACLDLVDRMILADCHREDATIADGLLALELIARRIQEAAA